MLIIRAAFDTVTIKSCLLALIPVSHKFLWYASCYIYLLILSPFLNLAINKMSKKCFQKLILVMIILLNVVPTFLYYDIMGDKGKGLVTMIELYFIGRYLKLYPIKIKRSTAIISFFVIMIIGFIGNIAATLVRSGETSFPFSRECTIISLSLAILLLLIAVDIPFYSKAINLISSKVFYAFLLSPQVILGFFLSVDNLKSSLLYLPACIGFVALSLVIVFALSFVLQYPAKLMTIILDKAEKLSVKLLKKFKFFNRIENYFINGDNVNG